MACHLIDETPFPVAAFHNSPLSYRCTACDTLWLIGTPPAFIAHWARRHTSPNSALSYRGAADAACDTLCLIAAPPAFIGPQFAIVASLRCLRSLRYSVAHWDYALPVSATGGGKATSPLGAAASAASRKRRKEAFLFSQGKLCFAKMPALGLPARSAVKTVHRTVFRARLTP